jgi:hypothetical protein
MRPDKIGTVVGSLSNEVQITTHGGVFTRVTMIEVDERKSFDQAAHVYLASA